MRLSGGLIAPRSPPNVQRAAILGLCLVTFAGGLAGPTSAAHAYEVRVWRPPNCGAHLPLSPALEPGRNTESSLHIGLLVAVISEETGHPTNSEGSS